MIRKSQVFCSLYEYRYQDVLRTSKYIYILLLFCHWMLHMDFFSKTSLNFSFFYMIILYMFCYCYCYCYCCCYCFYCCSFLSYFHTVYFAYFLFSLLLLGYSGICCFSRDRNRQTDRQTDNRGRHKNIESKRTNVHNKYLNKLLLNVSNK